MDVLTEFDRDVHVTAQKVISEAWPKGEVWPGSFARWTKGGRPLEVGAEYQALLGKGTYLTPRSCICSVHHISLSLVRSNCLCFEAPGLWNSCAVDGNGKFTPFCPFF